MGWGNKLTIGALASSLALGTGCVKNRDFFTYYPSESYCAENPVRPPSDVVDSALAIMLDVSNGEVRYLADPYIATDSVSHGISRVVGVGRLHSEQDGGSPKDTTFSWNPAICIGLARGDHLVKPGNPTSILRLIMLHEFAHDELHHIILAQYPPMNVENLPPNIYDKLTLEVTDDLRVGRYFQRAVSSGVADWFAERNYYPTEADGNIPSSNIHEFWASVNTVIKLGLEDELREKYFVSASEEQKDLVNNIIMDAKTLPRIIR